MRRIVRSQKKPPVGQPRHLQLRCRFVRLQRNPVLPALKRPECVLHLLVHQRLLGFHTQQLPRGNLSPSQQVAEIGLLLREGDGGMAGGRNERNETSIRLRHRQLPSDEPVEPAGVDLVADVTLAL